MVFPTILGRGRRLFPDGIDRLKFTLVETRTVGPDGVQVQVYDRVGWIAFASAAGRESEESHRLQGGVMDRDKIEGKLKEKEGELTGDEAREKQGEAQQVWGEAKEKARDVIEDDD